MNHRQSKTPWATPLIWLGTWKIRDGLILNGFHLWGTDGQWQGVYQTSSRAAAEARAQSRKVYIEYRP
jgi:hypothetical protein